MKVRVFSNKNVPNVNFLEWEQLETGFVILVLETFYWGGNLGQEVLAQVQ